MIEGEPIAVPRTASDAVWLAKDLAHVMDELAREGVSWDALENVDAEGLSAWWQLTHKFLEIAGTAFPAFLEEKNLSDPVQYRNASIRAEAARLASAPPQGPVIAAGSTGSIPATAELLSVIAKLPNGAVILPGLDRDMDDTRLEPDRRNRKIADQLQPSAIWIEEASRPLRPAARAMSLSWAASARRCGRGRKSSQTRCCRRKARKTGRWNQPDVRRNGSRRWPASA